MYVQSAIQQNVQLPSKSHPVPRGGLARKLSKLFKKLSKKKNKPPPRGHQNISHIFRKILLVRIGFGVCFFGLSSVLLFSFTVSVPSPPLRDIVVGALFLGFGLICGASVSRGFSSFVLLYLPSVLRWPSREGAFQNRRRCPFQSQFCSVFIHAHEHSFTYSEIVAQFCLINHRAATEVDIRKLQIRCSHKIEARTLRVVHVSVTLIYDVIQLFFRNRKLIRKQGNPTLSKKIGAPDFVGGVTGAGVPVGGRFGRWRRRHYLKIRSVCRGGCCCSRHNMRKEKRHAIKRKKKYQEYLAGLASCCCGEWKVGGVPGHSGRLTGTCGELLLLLLLGAVRII